MIKTRLEDLLERTFNALGAPLSPRRYKNEIEDKGRVDSVFSQKLYRNYSGLNKAENKLINSLFNSESIEQEMFEGGFTPSIIRNSVYRRVELVYSIYADEESNPDEIDRKIESNRFIELLELECGDYRLNIVYEADKNGRLLIDLGKPHGEEIVYDDKPSEEEFSRLILKSIMEFVSKN